MAEQLADGASAADRRHDRMISAFARAASSIAWQGPLQIVLDQLADEARTVSGADMCTVSLRSRFGDTFEMVGAAGCPGDYRDGLEQARSLGAPLLTVETFRTGDRLVADIDAEFASDERFAPLVKLAEEVGWSKLVAVPLTVREETVGAMTAFYARGNEPNASDLSFLTAMADHGALAVHTAHLLAQAREKAALEERAHMARDLHDAVSQLLFSMQLRTRALELEADRLLGDAGPLQTGLRELNGLITAAVDEMRTLVLHLRPTELREHALAPALRRLAEAVGSRTGANVFVDAADDIPALARPYDEHVYRIVQEAIGNAINHAAARRISVTLRTESDCAGELMVVRIQDDGPGFDPEAAKPGHLGLDNMRGRCKELGGRLRIESSANGTMIEIRIPLDQVHL
ncbi:sensor histidine kinase [Mycobacterium sp. 3519A]|uniref:GAF domain-containing sensor histidine kinase n=1 Tax=Mycobacterium sp. 3519A TaxID=2057184 RepID=UPI000C7A4770|nr:sensor histidine kinase [Mycobacterium sp. 3519A]